jgi:hypothetical protein
LFDLLDRVSVATVSVSVATVSVSVSVATVSVSVSGASCAFGVLLHRLCLCFVWYLTAQCVPMLYGPLNVMKRTQFYYGID